MAADPEAPPDPEALVPESLALAADFPVSNRDEWRTLVAAVLAKSGAPADADPEDALSYTTYDGIKIRPLYTAADAPDLTAAGRPGHPPYVRGAVEPAAAGAGWDVRVRHADPDPARVNQAVLADLETGATSLWLVIGDGALGADELGAALDGVYLDLAPIVLDAGAGTAAAAGAFLALLAERDVDATAVRGSLGADPIGARARSGAAADLDVLGALATAAAAFPNLGVATVDGTVYHDAGASDAQELGLAASVGVAYLRALTGAGLSVEAALDALEFRYAVTAEQFPSIAKLRAARRIWARVAELSGASPDRRGQRQHAVTSAAMLTRRDPWVNLLRTTIGCFAAAVGGAESITVAPFDAAIGAPDQFSRRIARNTHAVLHDESSLARVVDAAGGSWFVESLTDSLASAAWTVFTDIERSGGALARLDDGTVARFLDGVQAQRAEDIAHRRAPITGVTEFAFVGEHPVARDPLPPPPAGALLPPRRHAQDFEELRDRADAASARPRVFLAALGPVAQHSARLGFATNLFAAGGLEPVVGTTSNAAEGPAELVAAFRESGTTVACLCSADRIYEHAAAPVAAALRAAGATRIWLAGKAEVDGVDGTLFAGGDALEALRTTFDELGVN